MDGVLRIPMKHFFINQIYKIRLLGEIIQNKFINCQQNLSYIRQIANFQKITIQKIYNDAILQTLFLDNLSYHVLYKKKSIYLYFYGLKVFLKLKYIKYIVT